MAIEGLLVGRIVHVVTLKDGKPICEAAVISRVRNKDFGVVDLSVFQPSYVRPVQHVSQVKYGKEPFEWHYCYECPDATS